MANDFGQLGTGAGRHVHVEDDQVGLKVRQLGHGLNRLGQRAGDDPGAVEQAFGVQRLRPRVVDDQHFIRFVLRHAGQHLDLLHQAGDFEGAGQKRLPTGAHGGQAGGGVGFMLAEKQQRQLLFKPDLDLFGQRQALVGASEIDLHYDGRRVALDHGLTKGARAVKGHGTEFKKLQLRAQALSAFMVLQKDVDRFAQRRQGGVPELIAVAQAGARQALHQPVEFSDQRAAQSAAIVSHLLQHRVGGL